MVVLYMFQVPPSIPDNQALYALLGTLFGGVGLKIVERLFSKKDRQSSVEEKLRDDLWNQVQKLQDDYQEIQTRLQDTSTKYFTMLVENGKLNGDIAILHQDNARLSGEIAQLRQEIMDLRVKYTETLEENARLHHALGTR